MSEVPRLCPKCEQGELLIRTNRTNGSRFYGCSMYPACDHTEGLNEFWHMRAMGHPMLPLFDEEVACERGA